jgi:hypothetical protein
MLCRGDGLLAEVATVHGVLCWGRHVDDFFVEPVKTDVTAFRIHSMGCGTTYC